MTGNELAIYYHECPCEERKERVVRAYIKLINNIAKRYSSFEDMDDLVGVGYLGLCRAVEEFDPSKKVMFSTLAYRFISGYILHHIRDNSQRIKLPNQLWDCVNKYNLKYFLVTDNLSKPLPPEEVAMQLDCSLEVARFLKDYFENPLEYINTELFSSDTNSSCEFTPKQLQETHPYFNPDDTVALFNEIKQLVEDNASVSQMSRSLNCSYEQARIAQKEMKEYLLLSK